MLVSKVLLQVNALPAVYCHKAGIIICTCCKFLDNREQSCKFKLFRPLLLHRTQSAWLKGKIGYLHSPVQILSGITFGEIILAGTTFGGLLFSRLILADKENNQILRIPS